MKKGIITVLLLLFSSHVSALYHVGISANMTDINGVASHGYGIHAGTPLTHYLDTEFGYKRLGDDISSGYKNSYDSVSFILQPNHLYGPIKFYANLGVHLYSGENDIESHLVYGVGGEQMINRALTISAEYNFYNIGISDIESLTLKANYYF